MKTIIKYQYISLMVVLNVEVKVELDLVKQVEVNNQDNITVELEKH